MTLATDEGDFLLLIIAVLDYVVMYIVIFGEKIIIIQITMNYLFNQIPVK